MSGYSERHFVQALIPLLISRLPDPFSPNEADMLRVADAAGRWTEMLVDLRSNPKWQYFLLDGDGPTWSSPADSDD